MKTLHPLLAVFIVAFFALPVSAQEPNFGRALAVSGEDLLVGQPVNWYGPGTVYAYRLDADGAWVERALLTAPDSSRMDDFGRALALDGNTFVAGAPRKHDGSGVLYTFERTAPEADWSFASMVEPPEDSDAREFGAALALSGDELLVGSPLAEGTGVVYRYVRAGTGWTLEGTITPTDDEVTTFGQSLDGTADRLLVGAPGADSGAGRAFVVDREGEGWGELRGLGPSETLQARAQFGRATLLVGDRVLVGAPGAADVLMFELSSSGVWSNSATLTAFDATGSSNFGFSLAAGDGDLWVGAPGVSGADGRVYRFMPDGSGGWRSAVRVDPDETEGGSWPLGFGYSIAASDGRAVVGMPTRDFGEGRAMALSRSRERIGRRTSFWRDGSSGWARISRAAIAARRVGSRSFPVRTWNSWLTCRSMTSAVNGASG